MTVPLRVAVEDWAWAAKGAVMAFVGNAWAVADVIVSGLCHRYPKLNFVSVESGVGWVPFLLEALDWQWQNNGVPQEHPEVPPSPDHLPRDLGAQIAGGAC